MIKNIRNCIYQVYMKYLYCIISYGISTLFVIQPSFANGINQLKTFITEVTNAQGYFVQQQLYNLDKNTKENNNFQRNNIAFGNFIFLRPNYFIWHYSKPHEQLIQSDGKFLYVYDKDLKQVTKYKFNSIIRFTPASILFSSKIFELNFKIKEISTQNSLERVELIPNRISDSQFKYIIIGFKDSMIASMELLDTFDNITKLTFSKIQKNLLITNKNFSFCLPKNVDILSE